MKKTIMDISEEGLSPEFLGNPTYYETDKGIISLVYPCINTQHMYEIFCVKGDFFSDIEMYFHLEDAEKRIIELIGNKFKYGK